MATALTLAASSASPSLALELPPIREKVLQNGLTVLLAERGPIPMVTVRLVIRAGSASDPKGKEGLADFTTRLMRRGTQKLSAEALDDAVEFYGGVLGMETEPDYVAFTLITPSAHLAKMLDVLAQMVIEPAFAPSEVESAKRRVVGQIANMVDDPAYLADRVLLRALFGDHPYAHDIFGTTRAVESFRRQDVVGFHREKMGPKVSLLAIVGVTQEPDLEALLERTLGKWQGGPEVPWDPAPPVPADATKVVVVDKPDQTQSQVRVGALGVPKGHPDLHALRLLETALAGGFTSRLVEEIRVNRGLSYSIGAGFERYKSGGSFSVSTYTQSETTREILDAIFEEVGTVRKGGLRPAEVERVKRYSSGIFPMRLETNEAYAASIAEIKLYKLPEDHLTRYRERLNAVTVKDLKRVSAEHLFRTPPVIVIVGKADAIMAQLKGLGKVEMMPLAEVK